MEEKVNNSHLSGSVGVCLWSAKYLHTGVKCRQCGWGMPNFPCVFTSSDMFQREGLMESSLKVCFQSIINKTVS